MQGDSRQRRIVPLMISTRRKFLKQLVGSAAALAAPLVFGSRVRRRFPDDWTVDEVNRWLYHRGLRPCIHSFHSSDEEFAECVYDRFLKSLELSVKEIVRRDHAPFERIEIDPPHEGFRLVKLSVEGNPVPYTWKILYEL